MVFSRILVPTNFDDPSDRALDFGRKLADVCGASLHLLHVIGYAGEDSERHTREQAQARARLSALLNDRDVRARHATTACIVGTIAEAIVRYAADNAIDLVVMGTHTHGPTCQMVTGSITEGVIESSQCAVLAVKGPVEHRVAAIDEKQVAVGTQPVSA